jgi:aspartate carbamoyltransferase catalytic subunit
LTLARRVCENGLGGDGVPALVAGILVVRPQVLGHSNSGSALRLSVRARRAPGRTPGVGPTMDFYDYESRLNRPLAMKTAELRREERLKHVIFSAQFDRELLDHLGNVATMIRKLSRTKEGCEFLLSLLPHKRAMLYFTQPSTRTFLSFTAACQILGMRFNEVRDPSVSSEAKGESPFDSIRMFSSYFDVIIMRSKIPKFAECCAYLMNDLEEFNHRNVPIINGGAGADEHPTQALLDIYTIQRTFQFTHPRDSSRWTRFDELRERYPGLTKGLDGKSYGFCGDIGRGRTVRSLASLVALYNDVNMHFIAPDHEKLRLRPDMRNRILRSNVAIHEVSSFEEIVNGRKVIEQLDCLYMTRIQQEHNTKEDAASFADIDFTKYCLSKRLVQQMKEYAPILHPFPRDDRFREIPPEIDADPRAMYFHQARNGMWIRAALLANLFDVDGHIAREYSKVYSEFHDYNEGVL